MSATDSGPSPETSNRSSEENASPALARLLFFAGILAPLAATSVGIDAGPIFQIFTVDDLLLDPRTIGVALGLGTLSVPLQVWAARIPLYRAPHNLRLFVLSLGVMTLFTAALLRFASPASGVAHGVLVVAVLAEIALSVLYATSWQPVVAYSLSRSQRQFLNGQGRAVKGIVLLLAVLVFGQLGRDGRAVFIAVLGVSGIAMAWSLRSLPSPPTSSARSDTTTIDSNAAASTRDFTRIFLTISATGFAGWPLLVTYVGLVLWPTANLGVVGACLALGSIVGSLAWRDPGDRIVELLRVTAAAVLLCSIAIAAFDGPITTTAGVFLLAIITVGSAARSTLATALMELTHRRVDETNSVRVMTMLDVIGSTSHQVGFFVVGFLIADAVDTSLRPDHFQLAIVLAASALMVTTLLLRRHATNDAGQRSRTA